METTTRAPRWGDFDFDARLAAMPKASALAVLEAEFNNNDIAERSGRRVMMVNDFNARFYAIKDRLDPEKSAVAAASPAATAPKFPRTADEWSPVPDPSQENAPAHRTSFTEKIFAQWKDVAKETLTNMAGFFSVGSKSGINRFMLSMYLICFRRSVADELEELRKRIAELEARPQMKYCGVFEDDRAYGPGEFVTYGGSIWHCRSAAAGGRPGSSSSWQLAVKHGRDGRDAR